MAFLSKYDFIIFNPSAGKPSLGPNLRWHYLGAELVKSGSLVRIFSSKNFHKFVKNPNYHVSDNQGIKYFHCPNISYTNGSISHAAHWLIYLFFLPFFTLFHFVPKLGYKRVYVFSSPPIFHLVFIPLFRLLFFRSIIVVDFRDLWPAILEDISGKKLGLKGLVMMFCQNIALKFSHLVISPKEGDIHYFSKMYDIKFLHVSNGRYPLSINQAFPSIVRSDGRFVISYVGSFGLYYDITKIVSLFEVLYDLECLHKFKFVFAGSGSDYLLLERLLSVYPESSYEFFGKLSKAEADNVIFNSDACYLSLKEMPSNEYGISCNKIYDYMAFSKPIIGHYSPSIYDPILKSGCGICSPHGSELDLVDFLLRLEVDPLLRTNIGNRGLNYLNRNLTPGVVSDHLLSSINGL